MNLFKKLLGRLVELDNSECGPDLKTGFLESVECGQFTLDFYYDEENVEKCKVNIRFGRQMEVTLAAAHDGYGFLMSCRADGAKDAMEAYCGMLWQCSHLLAVSENFPRLVSKAWKDWYDGLEKQAEKQAKAVTEQQDEADEALMKEAVKVAEMADDARQAYHEEVAGKLADILEGKSDKKKNKKNKKK